MYSHIKSLLARLYSVDFSSIVLEKPKNKDLGHIATPLAFSLAKIKRANPHAIAQEIATNLAQCSEFDKVEALNGFVNFTLAAPFLQEMSHNLIKKHKNAQKDESILIEFVSANPTGPLHIGHTRGAVYGDVLARVGEFLGYKICREYYINDAGAQINNLGLSIFLSGQEHILKQAVSYPKDCYRGEYIIDIALMCEKHFGKDIFKHTDSISKLAEFGKNAMLQEIKDNLAQVGIEFNNFVSEKAMYEHWQDTLNALESSKSVYEKDNKIWLASSRYGDEKDRVIVRESGEPTYLAGDIIYHAYKFKRHFNHYINIWGADHHGYMQRVRAAIHFLGYDETKLEILLSQMVSLLRGGQPYKMGKRTGNFILMKDVVDDIGADAVRFIFLSKKADTHLEFDVNELKKQDVSNPIYYINYANARIHTIFDKAGVNMQDMQHSTIPLELPLEAKALLFEALCVEHIIESAFRDREMQKICDYLKHLAACLHSFYNAHKILQSPHEKSLLYVLMVVSHSLTLGLALLGIKAKTKM